jgi:hypothetical protein
VLARAHQDAIWRRTAASNELRSLLREYFPAFLDAFMGVNGSRILTPFRHLNLDPLHVC